MKIRAMLVLDDWRKFGTSESIYETKLGCLLSSGDLHSGATIQAEIELPDELAQEMIEASDQHGAYPVFRVVGSTPSHETQDQQT